MGSGAATASGAMAPPPGSKRAVRPSHCKSGRPSLPSAGAQLRSREAKKGFWNKAAPTSAPIRTSVMAPFTSSPT